MKYALVDTSNIVKNVIVYNGTDTYTPPLGLKLAHVNDWVQIEDQMDAPEPLPTQPKSDAELKQIRNKVMANDLSMVALYEIEKKSNPNLVFSDYVDHLETKKVD